MVQIWFAPNITRPMKQITTFINKSAEKSKSIYSEQGDGKGETREGWT